MFRKPAVTLLGKLPRAASAATNAPAPSTVFTWTFPAWDKSKRYQSTAPKGFTDHVRFNTQKEPSTNVLDSCRYNTSLYIYVSRSYSGALLTLITFIAPYVCAQRIVFASNPGKHWRVVKAHYWLDPWSQEEQWPKGAIWRHLTINSDSKDGDVNQPHKWFCLGAKA